MGNSDRWSTPKQIKIEREGEPRGTRRGPLKKGERRKGRKARIDELLSAKRNTVRYAEYIVTERKRRAEHPEWFRPFRGLRPYEPEYEKWFDQCRMRLDSLIAAALRDKMIAPELVKDFLVEKP